MLTPEEIREKVWKVYGIGPRSVFEDMIDSAIATAYAKALRDVARRLRAIDRDESDLGEFSRKVVAVIDELESGQPSEVKPATKWDGRKHEDGIEHD